MENIENIKWDFVKNSILNQKTILFIGEGLTLNYSDKNNERDFLKNFVEKSQQDILSYHEKDGFLVFKDKGSKWRHLPELITFYQQNFKNEVLEKLVEIPFHLIITVTPDLTLKEIFDAKKFEYQHDYYSAKKSLTQTDKKITAENPLLYQMLGSIKDDESLITSHHDLFSMMEAIYKDNNLSKEVIEAFSEGKMRNIIFLGFDFEKWYFQMLLHLLKINFESCTHYATQTLTFEQSWQTFYEAQFKINFINQDIDKFVNELHQKFTPEQLRKPVENKKTSKRIYKKDNILKFLSKTFNASDFETFCFINYEKVKDEFTDGTGQTKRLTMLMEYAEKNEDFDRLLELGKDENPIQYKNFEPYYEETQ